MGSEMCIRDSSNTENTLLVVTTDDLSGIVGNELIGVHQFDTLRIENAALVDFGGDRVEANNLEVSEAILRNVDLPESVVLDLTQNNVDGFFELNAYTFDNLTVSASGINFEQLEITDTLTLSAEISVNTLSAPTINISGGCLLYTSPSPRDLSTSRMPSSA